MGVVESAVLPVAGTNQLVDHVAVEIGSVPESVVLAVRFDLGIVVGMSQTHPENLHMVCILERTPRHSR
jgi:hypothetical protein